MSRILFWDYGDGGAADIAAAIAVYHGLKRPGKVLLLNEHKVGEGLESGLKLHVDGLQDSSGFQVREHGIESLLRLQANQRLSAVNFRDYTYSLIAEQLDVVSGFVHGKIPAAGLYRLAEQIYELTITYSSEVQTLPHSEPRVAVLSQNRMLLERFFEEKDRADRSDIRSSCEVLVLRDFDRNSRWTVNNIRRRYKARVPVIALDYCTAFRDAVNHRDLLRFMYYYTSEPLGKRTSGPFFSGLERLSEQIMQQIPMGRTLSAVGGEER
ncbi:hypothetical protein [Paenibacillus apis]|uniref:Uncharacterized protein n=1 Tax=Paenibacillus apis TaxID=1792174 RepID=A0A919Y7C6_9BACL|nr:hypothetical protein [Paenibacillus apis]GIO43655.1 hypothetical protein J41TS4_34130 [Paenibacillus apis]